MFLVENLGEARRPVLEPKVVAVDRRNEHSPPLPRELVCKHATVDFLCDRTRRQENDAGRGVSVYSTVLRFNEGETGLWCKAVQTGEEGHDLPGFFAVRLRVRRLRIAEEDA